MILHYGHAKPNCTAQWKRGLRRSNVRDNVKLRRQQQSIQTVTLFFRIQVVFWNSQLHSQLKEKTCKVWDLLITDLENLHVSTNNSSVHCVNTTNVYLALINILLIDCSSSAKLSGRIDKVVWTNQWNENIWKVKLLKHVIWKGLNIKYLTNSLKKSLT